MFKEYGRASKRHFAVKLVVLMGNGVLKGFADVAVGNAVGHDDQCARPRFA